MNIRRQSGTFHFEEDPLSKGAEGISKNYNEVLLLMKVLQTKPQVKSMNINYYDIFYTVKKKRKNKEFVNDDEYENEYINFDDFSTPNLYIGRKK